MCISAGTVWLTLIGSAIVLAVSVLCFVDYAVGQLAAVLLGAIIGITVLCCPRRCQVCRARIQDDAHQCVVDGEYVRVCPDCRHRIEREQERRGFHRLANE